MSNERPTVSVVIPVYNRAEMLGEALRSVLGQTFGDFEVVVVDDGSHDDVGTHAARLGDPRVRVLRHETNRGTSAARNTGIRAARGRYVAFLDSDDLWLPTKLAHQLEWLERAPPGTRLCCTGYTIRRNATGRARVRQPVIAGSCYESLLWGCTLSPGSTALVEHSCFDEIGGFDEELRRFEDWDWLLRYAQKYPIGIVPAVLATVRGIERPAGDLLRSSLERMVTTHAPPMQGRSRRAWRIFRATVALELAAQSYREGRRLDAVGRVLRSLAWYPRRDFAFFRRMLTRLGAEWGTAPDADAPPRVMHLITDLGTGGAERMLTHVLRSHPPGPPEPLVVTMIPGGRFARELIGNGVVPRVLDMRKGRASLGGLVRMIRLLRRERPAVLQTWMYHADLLGLLAVRLGGLRGRTKVYWGIRCSDMDDRRYGTGFRVVRRLCAMLSPLVEVAAANSYAGLTFHRRIGYRPRNFVVLENGVDVGHFRPDPAARRAVRAELGLGPEEVVAVAVARVDPMKDYGTLLDALGRVPGMTLLALGSGTESLPRIPRLHRLGERSDVARFLAAADMLVSASAFGEGCSNAILEGMACGLSVVATDVGDARRIVGGAGRIVPPRDPQALAGAMAELAAAPDLRRAMGKAALARVAERYEIRDAVKRLYAIYGMERWQSAPRPAEEARPPGPAPASSSVALSRDEA